MKNEQLEACIYQISLWQLVNKIDQTRSSQQDQLSYKISDLNDNTSTSSFEVFSEVASLPLPTIPVQRLFLYHTGPTDQFSGDSSAQRDQYSSFDMIPTYSIHRSAWRPLLTQASVYFHVLEFKNLIKGQIWRFKCTDFYVQLHGKSF